MHDPLLEADERFYVQRGRLMAIRELADNIRGDKHREAVQRIIDAEVRDEEHTLRMTRIRLTAARANQPEANRA